MLKYKIFKIYLLKFWFAQRNKTLMKVENIKVNKILIDFIIEINDYWKLKF